jgi:PelA/Pel-15E family pectate lyase
MKAFVLQRSHDCGLIFRRAMNDLCEAALTFKTLYQAWQKLFWRSFMIRLPLCCRLLPLTAIFVFTLSSLVPGDEVKPKASNSEGDVAIGNVVAAMKKASDFMTSKVAVNGGYVYEVSLDLKSRWGEGVATPTEIWVQPPGTPTVGMAFVRAYEATGDKVFLDAAIECARALMHGQLQSGCWSDRVDFDPAGKNAGAYRHGKGKSKGRNYSTLDDDKSQAALRLLIEVDRVLNFQDAAIHEAVEFGLDRLLKAQFANGGFPQGWEKPVEPGSVVKASYPSYEWRTEGRFKNYWDFETLNDGLAGTVTETLFMAFNVYKDKRYRESLIRFGDFLILAQMPEPQPAWAQQYNHQLQPIWARKFEPPAIAGRESEDAIETLMNLTEMTGERRFLEPIPAAIAWLKRSRLADGQIARFYELQTNTPLYLTKDAYELTYDDSNLPTHYSFKSKTKVDALEARYQKLKAGETPKVSKSSLKTLTKDAVRILSELDADGRWISDKKGKPVLSMQARGGDVVLKSEVFSRNLSRLSEFLVAAKAVK